MRLGLFQWNVASPRVASFKLALVKVCQGHGQGHGQRFRYRFRFRSQGQVLGPGSCQKDYRSSLYLYLKIYNFFVPFFSCNVLIMFWWILYAPLVVADHDFDHGFRRLPIAQHPDHPIIIPHTTSYWHQWVRVSVYELHYNLSSLLFMHTLY